MTQGTYNHFVQSKYFNPAFNSAIFDGPLRIYSTQFHENSALKVYFGLQQKCADELKKIKENYRASSPNILVILYPTAESFSLSFEPSKDFITAETLNQDFVIGINGPFGDEQLLEVLVFISQHLKNLGSLSSLDHTEVLIENQI